MINFTLSLEDRIDEYYRHSNRDFNEDLLHHSLDKHAIIHMTPTQLLLARPVSLDSLSRHIINPAHHYLPQNCNAWHIHLMIGSAPEIGRTLKEIASEFPYFSFQRNKKYNTSLRRYSSQQFIKKLTQLH